MKAPSRLLRTSAGGLELGGAPWLMGIVNASEDSFSDRGIQRTGQQRAQFARSLVAAGAAIVDVGGESAVTDRPPVQPPEELERLMPILEALTDTDVIVSVDTYKPQVAEAALAAGASIINDVSGLLDPELAEVCAASAAGLVLMHTRAKPKQRLLDPQLDGRVVDEVYGFFEERIELALARGMGFEQLMLDPGPDFSKTPAQTVEALRGFGRLHELGRPLLLAASRKDFIGAITGRKPSDRLAGTLAAVDHGVNAGAHVLRVHDVSAVADFLAVRDVLRGERELDSAVRLPDELRWEQGI